MLFEDTGSPKRAAFELLARHSPGKFHELLFLKLATLLLTI